MEAYLISIIIPTYNCAATLSRCLDSVLNQCYKNFEVIIVDGFSSDATMLIVNKYVKLNANIVWVSEIDKGIYDAMNKGIKMAKGEWLYFLGSDDILLSNEVLNSMNKVFNQTKAYDVIYGNVTSTKFQGIYDGEFTNDKIFLKNICHQAIFFKKEVFRKIGTFNLKYIVHADWDHNIRWFLSKKVKKKYVNIVCAEYSDGGFSSITEDIPFNKTKKWRYFLHHHKKLSVGYKYLIFKNELNDSIRSKDFRKLISTLFHIHLIIL